MIFMVKSSITFATPLWTRTTGSLTKGAFHALRNIIMTSAEFWVGRFGKTKPFFSCLMRERGWNCLKPQLSMCRPPLRGERIANRGPVPKCVPAAERSSDTGCVYNFIHRIFRKHGDHQRYQRPHRPYPQRSVFDLRTL